MPLSSGWFWIVLKGKYLDTPFGEFIGNMFLVFVVVLNQSKKMVSGTTDDKDEHQIEVERMV